MVRNVADVKVRTRAHYTGLAGSVLRNWGNTVSKLIFEDGTARSDEALLESPAAVQVHQGKVCRGGTSARSIAFETFGVNGLSPDRVRTEVAVLRLVALAHAVGDEAVANSLRPFSKHHRALRAYDFDLIVEHLEISSLPAKTYVFNNRWRSLLGHPPSRPARAGDAIARSRPVRRRLRG